MERALSMVQKAVDGAPQNSAYRDSLGWAYYRLERYDDAVRELEIAADGDDPDGMILDHLGDAYMKIGRKDDAIQTWHTAAMAFESQRDTKSLEAIRAKISQQSN